MPNAINRLQLNQGAVAHLVRSIDWSQSPLGEPDAWPHSLRTVASLILNSNFPMCIAWGPELGFIYNDAYAEILEDKHPSAFGQPLKEVWWDVWGTISPIVDKALAGQASYFENLPFTMHRKGYEEKTWFTFSYSPVHDESGKVGGMYCSCTETTKQVLAERLRVSEVSRVRNLFHQAPGIMAVLRHQDHVFELANQAYCGLVGHRELLGKPVKEALPEIEGQGLLELLDEVYSSGEPYVGRAQPVKLQRQPGDELEERYVDFVYQPIRNDDGEISGIFVEGSDVTEAVNATKALKESEEQLRQLANTIPHLAWMADQNGYMHWYNDRFYDYTGLTFEQAKGAGWHKIHRPDVLPSVEKEFLQSLERGVPFEMTVPLRSADGSYRTFYSKAAPLRDSSGNIVRWFGTNTDVHEMQKARDELEYANRRKDDFLAMLAHELRNPLAPISTAADLLNAGHLAPERIGETCEIIVRQAAHMTDLLNDLLDVSRVTRGLVTIDKEVVDLNQVLADARDQIAHLAEAKHQELKLVLPQERVLVRGDGTRLVQIFANLLSNANRYTPRDGRISVTLATDADQVEVKVEDSGVGIEPDLLPHVFELFTQAERSPDRSQGGLGLGLALVKSLVGLHGGSVFARSEGVDRGSQFVVVLPREEKIPAITDNHHWRHKADKKLTPQRVLIVDDNVDAAKTLAMLLESEGCQTETEYSAMDALRRVDSFSPDVVILDIGLPQMDGFELARRLRKIPRVADAKFIALTGYGQKKDIDESKAAGFDYHLIKPVNVRQLVATVYEQ